MTAQWNNANTDSKTPTIEKVIAYKRVDLTAAAGGDYVLCYSLASTQEPASLYYTSKNHIDACAIDMRTIVSRSRLIKLRDEVERIMEVARKGGTVGAVTLTHQLVNITSGTDLSDKSRGLHRYVYNIELKEFNRLI